MNHTEKKEYNTIKMSKKVSLAEFTEKKLCRFKKNLLFCKHYLLLILKI